MVEKYFEVNIYDNNNDLGSKVKKECKKVMNFGLVSIWN